MLAIAHCFRLLTTDVLALVLEATKKEGRSQRAPAFFVGPDAYIYSDACASIERAPLSKVGSWMAEWLTAQSSMAPLSRAAHSSVRWWSLAASLFQSSSFPEAGRQLQG
ncbi:hypothetical protein ASD52_12590 [Ensifer sp. Root142]|nr:hypothetical protein ASD52_12590 [Ensifer sp. Root142]